MRYYPAAAASKGWPFPNSDTASFVPGHLSWVLLNTVLKSQPLNFITKIKRYWQAGLERNYFVFAEVN